MIISSLEDLYEGEICVRLEAGQILQGGELVWFQLLCLRIFRSGLLIFKIFGLLLHTVSSSLLGDRGGTDHSFVESQGWSF